MFRSFYHPGDPVHFRGRTFIVIGYDHLGRVIIVDDEDNMVHVREAELT